MVFLRREGDAATIGIVSRTCLHLEDDVDIADRIALPKGMGRVGGIAIAGGASGVYLIGIIQMAGMLPCAHGQRNHNRLAGQDNITGLGDPQCSIVGITVDGVAYLEAVFYHHICQLPFAAGIQIQHSINGADLLDVSSNQIEPLNGADINRGICQSLGHQLHCGDAGASIDRHAAGNGALVAHHIGCHKGKGMHAVSQGQILSGNNAGIGNRVGVGRQLHPIRQHIHTGKIQRAVVCNSGSYGYHIVRNSLAVEVLSIAQATVGDTDILIFRSYPVIHSAGVVHSNIVDVHGELGHDVCIRSIVIAIVLIEVDAGQIVVQVGNVGGGYIEPASLEAVCLNLADVRIQDHAVVQIQLRHTNGFLWDVDPHTYSNGIGKIHVQARQGNALPAHAVKLGVVQLYCQSLLAIFDLAGLSRNDLERAFAPAAELGSLVKIAGLNGEAFRATVLKVVDNGGALAEDQACLSS